MKEDRCMNFKKAIVPSAFVVAGMTAMLLQPASNAAPQETVSNVSSTSTPDAKDMDKKNKKDSEDKKKSTDSVDGDKTKETSTPVEETSTVSTIEPKLRGVDTRENGVGVVSDGPSLDAKISKGTVNQSNSTMLREGSTPKKVDLGKFNITSEPEPKPKIVTAPQQQETYSNNASSSTTTQTQGPAPIYNANTGNAIVDAALSQVGTPYVYGGSQPGGFDCSGLTSWAYAQAGKSIPRTSGAQWSAGQAVSVNDMQPGDIVVSYGGGHVGIYIGNGQMVHAPTTGDVVKVSPLQPIDGVVRF